MNSDNELSQSVCNQVIPPIPHNQQSLHLRYIEYICYSFYL